MAKKYNYFHDYIKLTAEYLLDKNELEHNIKLRANAMTGELYAIQDWYKEHSPFVSRTIDRYVSYYKEDSIDTIYALSNYYSKDKDLILEYNDLIYSLEELEDLCKKTDKNTQQFVEYSEKLKDIKTSIELFPTIRLLHNGNKEYMQLSRAKKSPMQLLTGIKILEMLIDIIPFKFHKVVLNNELTDRKNTTFFDLLHKIKSLKKENESTYAMENKEITFALAYLIMTNNEYIQYLELAEEILKQLCTIEYSSQFKRYYKYAQTQQNLPE